MTLSIVLLLAIVSITGQFKSIQCVDDFSVLIDTFNIDAINESNLVCYLSMYSKIKEVLQNLPNMPENDVFSTISKINKGLHRVTNWNKYLMDSSLNTIWAYFKNYEIIAQNYGQNNDRNPASIALVLNYATSLMNGDSFNMDEVSILKTPKGIQFIETMHWINIPETVTELHYTFEYCSDIFTFLKSTTEDFEQELINIIESNIMANINPFWNTYGYTAYLMTKDEFNTLINVIPRIQSDFVNKIEDTSFVPHFAEAYLIVIIQNALKDIYSGMLNTLFSVNVSYSALMENGFEIYNRSIIHLKMISSISYNIVDLSQELHRVLKLYYVKEEIDIIKSSGVFGVPFSTDYTTSLKQFKKAWKLKVIQAKSSPGPNNSVDYTGRLVRNYRVQPSIIKYYSAYKNLWRNVYDLQYKLTTDPTSQFLLELNAWTILLYQQTTQLKDFLMQSRRILEESPDDRDFIAEREYVNSMKHDIQQI